MTKTIRVYSAPSCQQCRAVYRWLDKRNIPYTIEDATEQGNNDAMKRLGYAQAPVVFIGDQHFSGFNPKLLEELTEGMS